MSSSPNRILNAHQSRDTNYMPSTMTRLDDGSLTGQGEINALQAETDQELKRALETTRSLRGSSQRTYIYEDIPDDEVMRAPSFRIK